MAAAADGVEDANGVKDTEDADGANDAENAEVREQQLQQAWSPTRRAAAARAVGAPVGTDGKRWHGFGEDD
ncbi:hypothetical protein Scep_009553 [Stephania cephalantha]|uniref:Uncharacterized protein n=1 Tax=Stephania cephalantha TaxID=152367 RepID=A0AAP0JTH5_9MAGN